MSAEATELDATTIAKLKAAHGEALSLVQAADGSQLVFRKPNRLEYDRWFDKREEKRSEAGRELAQSCIVYPDASALFSVLERQPALLMCQNGCVSAITDLAGFEGVPSPKKL